QLHLQRVAANVFVVHVRDFVLSASGRLQAGGNIDNITIVEVESRDRVVRLRVAGLFFDPEHVALFIELRDAVAARVAHIIPEDGSATRALRRGLQQSSETSAVENIVTKNESDGLVANELAADHERLRESVWLSLLRVLKPH